MEEYPITLNYNREKIIGSLRIKSEFVQLLWGYHFAPAFVLKKCNKRGYPEEIEVGEIGMIADTSFTNWKGEKYYSQENVDKMVSEARDKGRKEQRELDKSLLGVSFDYIKNVDYANILLEATRNAKKNTIDTVMKYMGDLTIIDGANENNYANYRDALVYILNKLTVDANE